MSEVINRIVSTSYDEDGDEQYLITGKHTIADIARWIVENNWHDEILFMIDEEVQKNKETK